MAKRGRPFSDDPRRKDCRVRINMAENEMLEETCRMTGMGQADVFRTALERMFKEEKFKEEHPLSPLHDKRMMSKED